MCPHCKQPLIVVEFQGIEVDHCVLCRGIWCDAGELDLLTELAGVPAGELERRMLAGGAATRGTRRCPRCNRKMDVVQLGTPPVALDRCPGGDGIWLDAGELAAVVRICGGSEKTALAEFFGEMFRHELTGESQEKG